MPPRSTILTALFSPDEITNGTLDSLAQSLQDGLDGLSIDLPDVHCLYRRFSTTDPGSVHQFRLQKGAPIALGSVTRNPPDTIKQQLMNFFTSQPVKESLGGDGVVYLIIGAHGSPTGTQAGVILGDPESTRNAAGAAPRNTDEQRRKKESFRRPYQPLNPVGVAFSASRTSLSESITITELSEAIQSLCRPPQTLLLHCCFLSGIETIYELRQIRHHIACESQLKDILNIRNWFSDMAAGVLPESLKVFDNLEFDTTEGIFSSHWTKAPVERRTCEAPAYIEALNQLGKNLQLQFRLGHANEIEAAVNDSRIDGEDIVDLWQFCTSLTNICDDQVLKSVKAAIDEIQIRHALTSADPAIENYRGICVCIGRDNSSHGPKQLPVAFTSVAGDWIAFLVTWHSRSRTPVEV